MKKMELMKESKAIIKEFQLEMKKWRVRSEVGVEVSHQSSNQNRYGSILHGVVDLRIKYVDTYNQSLETYDLDSRTFPIPILSCLPANRTMQLGEKEGKDANITKTTPVSFPSSCDKNV